MKKVTFLGPVGATFSHKAYDILSGIYGTPPAIPSGDGANCIPAPVNEDVLKMIGEHGGYGALAMETLASGRVAEPLEAFMRLLQSYSDISACPFRIVGATKLKIRFEFMCRPDADPKALRRAIAHAKALDACQEQIASWSFKPEIATTNGEAARLVAESPEHADCAAIGPESAAKKYGLKIFDKGFGLTTFFLIAPAVHRVAVGKENRILIVFKVPHRPGAYIRALIPFEQAGLNLIQVHSMHVGNHTYDFVIELEAKQEELPALEQAMKGFREQVTSHLAFGPFEVLKC